MPAASPYATIRTRKVFDSCTQVITVEQRVTPCPRLECAGFVEYPKNPVFAPGVAYYETVRYDPLQFSPYGPQDYYKMWYDYSGTGGIAVALSPDGIAWRPYANTSGLIATARHSRVLFDRGNFGIAYPYRIWYWDSAHTFFPAVRHPRLRA